MSDNNAQSTNRSQESIKSLAIKGFLWRFLQSSSSQIINFIISIVLARLLTPDDYGLVSMVSVFTMISMVFVNTGFSSAVVQKKEITNQELSSVFYCSVFVGIFLYALMYIISPMVASFYEEAALTGILRVQSLALVIAAIYSVPMSLINRQLQFRLSTYASLIGAVVHGIVGIVLALCGFGVWALVYGTLSFYVTECICVLILVKWKPELYFSFKLLKPLFSFSSKVLAVSLLNQVFNNIRSLIIGKVYSSEDLAFYNKGYQFPTLIMGQVEGSMSTVMFSSFAKYQDTWETEGLSALRRSMRLSLFVCTPLMAGMCAVAEPMIRVLLTEKWMESVVYVRLVAILCVTWPLAARVNAMNARGYSGISLKLNMIGKAITLVMILLTYKISVTALIVSTIVAAFLSQLISCFYYRKYLAYPIKAQLFDILPSFAISAVMGVLVYELTYLGLPDIPMLIVQILSGILIYVVLSRVLNKEIFLYTWNLVQKILGRKKI